MTTILLDFESRSRCDLKKHGGRLYWEHPSSEALCAVLYEVETGSVEAWTPASGGLPRLLKRATALAAHNATGFDRFAAIKYGWCDDAEPWIDTSELARRAGLPGALDALGTRWLGLPKDKKASAFTRGLSTCRRPSGKGPDAISPEIWRTFTPAEKRERGVLREITPDVLDAVIAYCASDVEIMAHGWEDLSVWEPLEKDVSTVERAVNDRGVYFDRELAARLLECDKRLADKAIRAAAQELGMSRSEVAAIARSPEQFTDFTGAPNAQKETIDQLLADDSAPYEAQVMAGVRRALASIARGKLEAGLARVSADSRLRDTHRYYGAHTGRWSGRGMQLQNLTRPAKRFEDWTSDELARFADLVKSRKHWATAEEIKLLLRATICAAPGHTFAVCDFSGVEARALAWCADDFGALRTFESGRDPYKVMAASIFGCSYDDIGKDERRQVGKIAELACGYGMGGAEFGWTAAKGGSDLEALGIDPFAVVGSWRRLHAPIVRFWYALERAFAATVVNGGESGVDCFDIVPGGDGDVAIVLPSGRPIVYTDTRVGRDEKGRPRLSYVGNKGREHTYGGKLTENVVQALCRDLLADALVRAEEAGLSPVMHVHDEIVCEVPRGAGHEGLVHLQQIMTTLPEWAAGFPIGAAGFRGERYRK